MAKKVQHVSDISGKDITDHVQIMIKKADHGLRIGGNLYFGDTILDVDESELPTLFDKIKIVPSVTPELKRALAETGIATADFASRGRSLEVK